MSDSEWEQATPVANGARHSANGVGGSPSPVSSPPGEDAGAGYRAARRRKAQLVDPTRVDRLPPHSVEAEQGVLGCVLLGGRDTFMEACETITRPEMFYDLRHRGIWETFLAMDAANIPMNDLIAVQQRLKDNNQLEAIGGLAYLMELPDKVPSAANLTYYTAIVVEKFALRSRISLCTEFVGQAYEHQGAVDTLLESFERDVLNLADSAEASLVVPMKDRVMTAISTIENAFEHRNHGLMSGLQTHFSYLDKKTTGPHPGQLWLIGGRPSTGKTSLLVSMMLNMAIKGKLKIGFLSLEMSGEEITLRMLCNLARASMKQIHSGMISKRDKSAIVAAVPALAGAGIYIDDTPALTPQGLRMRGRRLVSRYGCDALFIDHLAEISDPVFRGDEMKDAKAAVSAARWLSKILKVPVIAAQQLNREFEKDKTKRKPRMSDLRGHGANEQMADLIGILYRDYQREEENNADFDDDADVWLNTLEICKQRNGPTGPVQFVFDRPTMRYEDATYNSGNRADGARRAKQQEEEL